MFLFVILLASAVVATGYATLGFRGAIEVIQPIPPYKATLWEGVSLISEVLCSAAGSIIPARFPLLRALSTRADMVRSA